MITKHAWSAFTNIDSIYFVWGSTLSIWRLTECSSSSEIYFADELNILQRTLKLSYLTNTVVAKTALRSVIYSEVLLTRSHGGFRIYKSKKISRLFSNTVYKTVLHLTIALQLRYMSVSLKVANDYAKSGFKNDCSYTLHEHYFRFIRLCSNSTLCNQLGY